MFRLFRDARNVDWQHAWGWAGYTLLGGCLGFWGVAYVLFVLFAEHITWTPFVGHAELALFSAGILAPTLPIITRDLRGAKYAHPKWMLLWVVFLLLLGAITFVSVTLAEEFHHPLHNEALISASLALSAFGFVTAFFVELGQSLSSAPNVPAEIDEQIRTLSESVSRALEKRGG